MVYTQASSIAARGPGLLLYRNAPPSRREKNTMPAPKCPFQNSIISEDFACALAQQVTVRNTPQVHCRSSTALDNCQRLYTRLKAVGLPAFGMQDDLATTPSSVYLKIQYGGLLGLQDRSGATPARPGTIADIHDLVDNVTAGGTETEILPYADLVDTMLQQQLRRRRSRAQ
jgi:hypothetical protein